MKSTEFLIRVTQNNSNELNVVEIETDVDMVGLGNDAEEFEAAMCACEYFMHLIAIGSKATFERALELLVFGAHEYSDNVVMMPGKEGT